MIPTVALLLLWDAGFQRNMVQARREREGLLYAGRVYDVQHAVSTYQMMLMAGDNDSQEALVPDVERALAELVALHEDSAQDLRLAENWLARRGFAELAPQRLRLDWEAYRENRSAAGFSALLDATVRLSATVLDLSGATQDPALDTNALIRGSMVYLPEYARVVSELVSYPDQTEGFRAYRTLLDNLATSRIEELIQIALREDAQWFSTHPRMQQELRERLAVFRAGHRELMGHLDEQMMNDPAVHDAILASARGVFEAAHGLYGAGSNGIRATIRDRLRTLLLVRASAVVGTSLVIILVAALLVWIRRSVSRSVAGIIDYTRRIANGDYAARLRTDLSDDLAELYEHTRVMVAEISQLAEFPRRNPNGVVAAGMDGEIIYRNPAAQQFLDQYGIEIDALLPESHDDIIGRLRDDDVEEQRVESRLEDRHLEWTYHPIRSEGLVHVYFSDITDRKRAEEQLLHDAFHDSLTGLANRALLLDRIEQTRTLAHRDPDMVYAVMLLDIDRFKLVNESLGHGAGDELLRVVGARITDMVGSRGTVARLGGDEFAVLLAPVPDSRTALGVASRLHEVIAEPLVLSGSQLSMTASIGIVFPANDRSDAESIVRDADTAMYRAKGAGRSRSEVFDSSMYQDAIAALSMEVELAEAIKQGQIVPYYQPIVSLESGRIAGFEALARWHHPERGLISPGRFIPLAEETGLIVPLGEQIMASAIEQACEWRRSHRSNDELMIGVNLSVTQFTHPELEAQIASAIEASDMRPGCVKLEITESSLMGDVERSMQLLSRLKALEIQLGIDDFGTGYSSLSYLHRFPFDILKVDQSFVGQMEREAESREIVTSIVSLAHGLEKQVIAEGIESPEQLTALRTLGSEYGQGFLFSRPLPAGEAGDLLSRDPRW